MGKVFGHWIVVAINGWLLVANLIFACYFWTQRATPRQSWARVMADAEQLEMKAVYANDSLALFIDKAFPRTKQYLLMDYEDLLFINGEDRERDEDRDDAGTKALSASLGEDFNVRFNYSLPTESKPKVHHMTVTIDNMTLFDLNADGIPDMQSLLPTDGSPIYENIVSNVFYNGTWQKVDREAMNSQYSKTLIDGTVVRFDREKGQWLSQ